MEEMQEIVSYKNHTLRRLTIVGFLLLLLGAGRYLFFVDQNKAVEFHYVTEPAHKGDLQLTVATTGYIQPVESVDVGTEVSGTIEKVYVDYNDKVSKGELLAVLDKTKYESAYSRAKAAYEAALASVESAKAQLYQAEQKFKRDKILRKNSKGALPAQNDYDRDQSAWLAAKAQLANAKALSVQAKKSVDSAKYDLDKTKIYSPIEGVILVRNVDPGQTVAASFQTPVLFKIAKDLTHMELQASIDEADVAKIKAGQKVTFDVDAYDGKIFNATVSKVHINSQIVDGVVTYLAIIDVDNSDLLLRPGMSANANIVTKTVKDAYIVSRSALLYIPVKPREKKLFAGAKKEEKILFDPKPHVWILKNGTPQKVYVTLLGSNGNKSAIVSRELKRDDAIIVSQEKQP